MTHFFESPLWFERRTLILKILSKYDIKKIVDYGCNVGNILEVLLNNSNYNEIIGVDCDEKVLKEAYEKCKVSEYYKKYMKISPLNIKLLKGDIKYTDKRLLNSEALVCTEVIEHLDSETLEIFPEIVFGTYKPKIVIITTPNIEFNYYFKELNYGKPNQKLRHEEHNFEWTREEFNTWVKNIAEKYNYKYEITGVGEPPEEQVDGDRGFCTQVASFERIDDISDHKSNDELKETFECLYNIDYPYFDQTTVSSDEVLKELIIFSKYYIERNEQDNIDENKENKNLKENHNNDTPSTENKNDKDSEKDQYQFSIELEKVWNDYYINRLCSSKEKLKQFLQSDKIKNIFYYDNSKNDENSESEMIYIRNVNEIFKYYDEYFPKQPSEEEFSDNDFENNYNKKYTESEGDDNSFWDNYSDYHIDDEYSD